MARNEVRFATVMLVLVTVFWGLSFPLVKSWQAAAGRTMEDAILTSLTLIALRMLPALVLLSLCRPDLVRGLARRELTGGSLLGLVFFAGFSLQMWALAQNTVTPALSAFLTSLACVWTPLLGWLLLGVRIRRILIPGLALAVLGTVLMSGNPEKGFTFSFGAAMTLLASVLFSVQILVLDRLGRGMSGERLTVGFFGVAGLVALLLAVGRAASGVGLATWLEWLWDFHRQPGPLLMVALLILLPTVLSFHWMNVYQPRISATRAALLYLLEPVFASILSIPWGLDELNWRLALGGALIVAGNALVEWRGRASTT